MGNVLWPRYPVTLAELRYLTRNKTVTLLYPRLVLRLDLHEERDVKSAPLASREADSSLRSAYGLFLEVDNVNERKPRTMSAELKENDLALALRFCQYVTTQPIVMVGEGGPSTSSCTRRKT